MQRQASRWKGQGTPVALVPTMGYLHDGHLSLVRRARKLMGRRGVVVVSIYVNPTQFAPTEDLRRYPRDLARDKKLCRADGANVIFAPDDEQMYPGKASGQYSTYVIEENLSRGMEGQSRPAHFRGVTTIVAKLLLIVQPDVAVFGTKDFQQAALIKRMVRNLNFPVKIVVEPTVRERDGLAMSSRNQYLEGDLRLQARVLWQAIQKARAAVRANRRPLNAASFKKELKQFIEHQPAARVDYIEFFEPATLRPVSEVAPGSHMALAVFVGKTRLIDNGSL
jgi:pantoate--beta-alanine ligase